MYWKERPASVESIFNAASAGSVRFPGIEGGLGEGEQDCLLQIGQVDQSVMTA